LSELQSADIIEIQRLQHLPGIGVHLNDIVFQCRHLRNVIISAFTFLFLQLDGNTSDLRVSQSLHQMSNESCDFVAQRFRWDYGDFLADAFVGVEIQSETSVVLLDNHLGGFFHRLGTYATHFEFILQEHVVPWRVLDDLVFDASSSQAASRRRWS